MLMPVAVYDDFAWFYHRYWNEEFHSLALPILERIWLPHVPPGAHILDLCCGTGYLDRILTERGYSVTGVDASPEMLAYARAEAPLAHFEIADVTTFQTPVAFDAAVSTFDSFNHLLSLGDLRAAFRHAAAALKPGAPFAFDVLHEAAYQSRWGESFVIRRDDHLLTITGAAFDFRTSLAQCTITMFRLLDNAWRRGDVTIHERCHSPEEIHSALEDAGFTNITPHPAPEQGMSGDIGKGRVFYLCGKGASACPDRRKRLSHNKY